MGKDEVTYKLIPKDKQQDCVLCQRQALDESKEIECCTTGCEKCGWNIYENRRRKMNTIMSNSFKWWKQKNGQL